MRIRLIMHVVLIAMLGFWCAAFAQTNVPNIINYQGQLVNADGTPITPDTEGNNQEFTIEIRIFDGAEPGATEIYGPQSFPFTPIIEGYYNILIGPEDSQGRRIDEQLDGADLYLEVKVGELVTSPRQRILSAPFAFRSKYAAIASGVETGAINASMIAANAVGASQIAPNAVGASEIADASVGAAEIGPNAVGISEIQNSAVTSAKIANGAVGSAQVADNSIQAVDLATGSVGTDEIQPGAITKSLLALLIPNYDYKSLNGNETFVQSDDSRLLNNLTINAFQVRRGNGLLIHCNVAFAALDGTSISLAILVGGHKVTAQTVQYAEKVGGDLNGMASLRRYLTPAELGTESADVVLPAIEVEVGDPDDSFQILGKAAPIPGNPYDIHRTTITAMEVIRP